MKSIEPKAMETDKKQSQQPVKPSEESKDTAKQRQQEAGAARPEQVPDVPPQERTTGIP